MAEESLYSLLHTDNQNFVASCSLYAGIIITVNVSKKIANYVHS